MNLLNDNRPRMLVLFAMIVALTVASAFSVVWLRQQTGRIARVCAQQEALLLQETRRVNYLDERIAQFHQPAVLQSRVMGHLRQAENRQVVWVTEPIEQRGRVHALSDPYRTTVDLALLDVAPGR